jgi:hypothetical protein
MTDPQHDRPAVRPEGEPPRWLDDFANVRKVYLALWAVCLLLLVGGEVLLVRAHRAAAAAGTEHHGFAFERWPGFYALFGFVACVALVLSAKELRKLVMRPEDYYDD